jgi:hypothetical protein
MIEQILGHALGWLLDRKMTDDALSPGTKSEGQDVWRLRYSWGFRVLWLFSTAVWAAAVMVFVWLALHGPLDQWVLALPLFGAALIFSMVTVRNALTQEVEVSSWGITERRSGSITRSFPWSAVTDVRFVPLLDAYRLGSADGQVIQFSMHIQGLPRFKSYARKYVPPAAIESVRARIGDLTRL